MKLLILNSLLFLLVPTAFALNFQSVYQAALLNSEKVAQSQETVTQAEEQISQARGAILPNVSFNASHTRQDQPTDAFAQSFSPATQDSARLTMEQPIFHGLSEFAAFRQRKNNLEAQKFNKTLARIQLYQDVASNYFNILSLEQDLKNLKEQLDLYQDRVSDLQKRAKRGESNVTEALTAQSTQASLEAEVQLVRGQLITAREQFAFYTGLDSKTAIDDISKDGKEITSTLKDIQSYLQRVEERPDIQGARAQLKAAEEEVRVARGGHWPSIDAVGNYHLKRPVAFLEDIKWDVELRLKFPIFEGGTRQSQVREATSKKRVQDLELARLRRQAVQQIRTLYESLKARMNQVSALEKTVALSEKNYKVLQREFRNGLVRSIDAQVALTEFRVARRTYDQARYAAQVDLVSLEAAAFMVPNEVIQ